MSAPSWNGEAIRTSVDSWSWYAVLDNYDPTPWDSETPARGPHAIAGRGNSEAQAICDLVERLVEL